MAKTTDKIETIDMQAIIDLTEDVGRDAARRLVRIFARECAGYCERLADQGVAGDYGQIELIAHSLKSSARQFGASRLSGHCHVLEGMARDSDGADYGASVEKLCAEARHVIMALEEWSEGQDNT